MRYGGSRGIRSELKDGDLEIYNTLEVEMPLLLLNGDVTVRIFHLDEGPGQSVPYGHSVWRYAMCSTAISCGTTR
eukprot:2046982-Rhodomonas_salina.3